MSDNKKVDKIYTEIHQVRKEIEKLQQDINTHYLKLTSLYWEVGKEENK